MTDHTHFPFVKRTLPFRGCVNPDECNPVAHGNCCEVETCRCGYERRTNLNAGQEEVGRWTPGPDLLDKMRRQSRVWSGKPSWQAGQRDTFGRGLDLTADLRVLISRGQVYVVVGTDPVKTTLADLKHAADQDDEDLAAVYRELYLDAEAALEGGIR